MPGRKITRKIRYVESDNSIYEYIWSAEDSTSYASTTNFYLTYNNVNYYFSKPNGISVGGKFEFNTSTKVLKYNNTTINTSSTGSGATLLNFVASHKWSNEYINIGANAENVICSDGKTVEEKLGGLGGNYVDKAGDTMTGTLTTPNLIVGSQASSTNLGTNATILGYKNTASGRYSTAEGISSTSSGNYSHTEGGYSIAIGECSHAEGYNTFAYGKGSHVEGYSYTNPTGGTIILTGEANAVTYTTSDTNNAKIGCYISANNSMLAYSPKIIAISSNTSITLDHTLGSAVTEQTYYIHQLTMAEGEGSHAEGMGVRAIGNYSHAEGQGTIAGRKGQHVQGKYNISESGSTTMEGTYLHIVGNGTSNSARSNAHTLANDGTAWFAGDVYVGSTSGTNKDAGSKKLATEDYVETNGGKIDSISVDGTAQTIDANKNVNLTGLEKTTNKVTSLSSSSTDSQYPSAKAVYDTIEALPEPMVFKGSVGTGGTITILPTTGSADVGDTYKVITNGTYAGKTAKIGDTFICLTKTSNSNTWELIPSGDEPSGTVTSITLKATSPISIDSSSAITTSGTRTLSHANSGVTAGTYKSVTVNATGHITAGTNPTTIDDYGITDIAVRKYNGNLVLTDGSVPDLQNNTFYSINGLSVNGTFDEDFSYGIIFFWQSSGYTHIDLISRYTKCGIQTFGKRYIYSNNVWTVQDQNQHVTSISSSSTDKEFPTAKAVYDFVPNITYSTTDLIAGSSALETGKFYFVYE